MARNVSRWTGFKHDSPQERVAKSMLPHVDEIATIPTYPSRATRLVANIQFGTRPNINEFKDLFRKRSLGHYILDLSKTQSLDIINFKRELKYVGAIEHKKNVFALLPDQLYEFLGRMSYASEEQFHLVASILYTLGFIWL